MTGPMQCNDSVGSVVTTQLSIKFKKLSWKFLFTGQFISLSFVCVYRNIWGVGNVNNPTISALILMSAANKGENIFKGEAKGRKIVKEIWMVFSCESIMLITTYWKGSQRQKAEKNFDLINLFASV